jgi:protein TonB
VKPPDPTEMVQPTQVPDKLPPQEDAPAEDFGVPGGVEGGVPGGVLGGVLGGVPGGVPGGVLGGTGEEPVMAGVGGVSLPTIIPSSKIKPEYPEVARKARIAGKVLLSAVIDREGNVTDVTVLKGHPMLNNAAIDAVKKWKYKPAIQNGKPVKVYMTVGVDFTLS